MKNDKNQFNNQHHLALLSNTIFVWQTVAIFLFSLVTSQAIAIQRYVIKDSINFIYSNLEGDPTLLYQDGICTDINDNDQIICVRRIGQPTPYHPGPTSPYIHYYLSFTSTVFIRKDGVETLLASLPGDNFITPTGINNQEQAAGYSTSFIPDSTDFNEAPLYSNNAIFWTNGNYYDITPKKYKYPWDANILLGTVDYTSRLNNNGQVVGIYDGNIPFIWNGSASVELSRLPFPYDNQSNAVLDINDRGQIVGYSQDTDESIVAVTWVDGQIYPLDGLPSGNEYVSANSINNNGQIVGFSSKDFIYWELNDVQGGYDVHSIAPISTGFSLGKINDRGQVVGKSLGRAFLWTENDGMLDLTSLVENSQGFVCDSAIAINNVGHILAKCNNSFVILTPKIGPAVEIRVDANRNGEISFDDSADKTSASKPYRFWLNDDDDAPASAPAISSENPAEYPAKYIDYELVKKDNGIDLLGTNIQDSSDSVIDHYRDLEDFAQLQIRTNPDATNLLMNGYNLALETTGGLKINLFSVKDKGQEYIYNKTKAEEIVSFVNQNGAVNQDNFVPTGLTSDKTIDTPFIFEGVHTGKGVVRVVLRDPSGMEVTHDEIDLELLRARDMYEYARGTANRVLIDENSTQFPPPYSDAYRRSPPAVGYQDLTPDFEPPVDEQKSVIIFVHGCCVDDNYWQMISDTAFKRLWWQGYRGRFASFRWPAIAGFPPTTYNRQEFNAWTYGSALRDYINNLRFGRWADYKLFLFAHSMGNVVATEAQTLGPIVNRYILSQAAVPADCYDSNPALLHPNLVFKDKLDPAPYQFTTSEWGYAGYCRNIAVFDNIIINFSNPIDGALASWYINNLNKPDDDNSFLPYSATNLLGGEYVFNRITRKSFFRDKLLKPPTNYPVTNPVESLAFVSRSHTFATGAEIRTAGPITDFLNLQKAFGLTFATADHAGQFERSIQDINGYYSVLLRTIGQNLIGGR